MKTYTSDSCLRLARRVNNRKRTYLLVNPLQGKHLPVSPIQALEMMKTLGDRLAAEGLLCRDLVKLPQAEYTQAVAGYSVLESAVPPDRTSGCDGRLLFR